MKIVHAVYGMEMGGMEVLVAQLCRMQRSQGHLVSVFAYAKLGVLGEQLRAEGFEVYVPGEAHPLQTMWRYWKRFRSIKPDVVHSHGIAPTIHATFAARVLRVRAVLSTRHNLIANEAGERVRERQYNVVSCFCHFVTGICQTTSEQLRRPPLSWRRRIRTVFNGVEPVQFTEGSRTEKPGPTILFVGRLMPVKSLHTLIHAFNFARQYVLGLNLWLVGDGGSRTELEALVADLGLSKSVKFWGQTMSVAPFFQDADIFAMSSTSEGLPMSLLQAMSAGLPCVTTNVGGMGEVLRLTNCGLLAPVGDHISLGESLVRIVTDSDLRSRLSQNAMQGYEAHFTLERMAAHYMELYRHAEKNAA